MRQHELRPPSGAKKSRKRVGRGDSSGHGSYSGRGVKGQKARSGFSLPPAFQGGGLSLIKSLPSMRGFTNIFRKDYTVINLDQLAAFTADSEVIQRNLEVVTFNPGEESGAGDTREGSGYKNLLIGLVVFNLLAFGVLGYLRYRNRAAVS